MVIKDKNEVEERRLRARIVGEFLKDMRQKSGLTQQELASKLSYSTAQFISNWERGISLPPLEVLPRLAMYCKIPPRTLVDIVYEYQEALLRMQKKHLLALFTKQSKRA